MPRFALYYIPAAHSPFYRLGTSILGYDIRREQASFTDNFIRGQLPHFDEAFVKLPQPHGLHCTILAPQECESKDLDAVIQTIERILNCFAQESVFAMQTNGELIHFWGKKREIVVLRYEPNQALLLLHTLLISSLAPAPRENLNLGEMPLHHAYRQKYFHNSFIFDDFLPHFTLLYPYQGHEHEALASVLQGIFRSFTSHKIDSLCLVYQEKAGENWRIFHEFQRSDYPQQA